MRCQGTQAMPSSAAHAHLLPLPVLQRREPLAQLCLQRLHLCFVPLPQAPQLTQQALLQLCSLLPLLFVAKHNQEQR